MVGQSAGEGPAYTRGGSYRARAEAHQRGHRAHVLGCGHAKYGHLLDEAAAAAGGNFIHPSILEAVRDRRDQGKGVHWGRTTGNMLSSQALCFNLLHPLSSDPGGLELAARALGAFVPGLGAVETMELEYTPDGAIFADQRGPAGVDCDALVRLRMADGRPGVLVIETKYVETSFSRCGYRKSGHKDPCPDDVLLGEDCAGCRYVSKRGFRYWARTLESGSLDMGRVRQAGCPFAGPLWQLWVNHTLAHALAAEASAPVAMMGVLAPEGNDALLRRGEVLASFRSYLADPGSLVFIPLEALLEKLVEAAAGSGLGWSGWAGKLQARYLLPTAER